MAEYDARMYPEDLADIGFRADWTRYYNPTTSEARMYLETARGTTPPAPPPVGIDINNITVPASTSIRVNFTLPAKDNEALRSPDNYVITPTLEVLSVTPEAVADPTYVILETKEQKQSENYSLEIKIVEAA